jgi:hypothetical protein
MNDYEKQKLQEHWQKPGTLKTLLETLPLVPYDSSQASIGAYKKVAWMTGIGFDPVEMAQVYYLLEEIGAIVRDGPQPEPAEYLVCTHPGANNPCLQCVHEINKRGTRAAVRYRLSKPLAEY